MWSWDFWLGVLFLAIVPFVMAAYGAHVAAEPIPDLKHRLNVRLKFWGIGLGGIIIAVAYQHRYATAENKKQAETALWEKGISAQLDLIVSNPASRRQQSEAIQLRTNLANPPSAVTEPITLKSLFHTDFGPHLSRPTLNDLTLTSDKTSPEYPGTVFRFTAQEYLDFDERTRFLAFYLPSQEKDPQQSSKRNAFLCRRIIGKLADLFKQFDSLQVMTAQPDGGLDNSANLPFSGRIYFYHEDFMAPEDIGDLIRDYRTGGLSLEFRGSEYLGRQMLLNSAGQHK